MNLAKYYETKCLNLLENIELGNEIDVKKERDRILTSKESETKVTTAMDNLYVDKTNFEFLTDEEFEDLKKCNSKNYLDYLNRLDKGFFWKISSHLFYDFEYSVKLGRLEIGKGE